MRYSYEYKRQCVEMYRKGKWKETPDGIKKKNFRAMIRRWNRMEKSQGIEVLKEKEHYKTWIAEEMLDLVSQVLAGKPIQTVALSAGINGGMLYHWVQKYKTKGYNGLVANKGRPPKEPDMKQRKASNSTPLTESAARRYNE